MFEEIMRNKSERDIVLWEEKWREEKFEGGGKWKGEKLK
jgi:hypothetical protein